MDQNVVLMIVPFSFDVIKLEIRSLPVNEISRFSNVIPKIFFKSVRIQLTFFGQLRENLLFNHTESFRNTINDFLVENVHTGVNLVADELFWLFDEAENSVAFICHYNTESAWVFDCGQYN
jgi:hypothetical protein